MVQLWKKVYIFLMDKIHVGIYGKRDAPCPLVVLNTVNGEGQAVYDAVGSSDITLMAVDGLSWNDDLSPWAVPAVFRNGEPFGGLADSYIGDLVSSLIPDAVREYSLRPSCMIIAGYSLAGLFAVYSAYRTDMFSRIVSVSGSLWFPGFLEYALSNSMKADPEKVYLSLGDREARTVNPVMKTVQDNTERLHEHFLSLGISSEYELNPGNHFQDAVLRMAKGIRRSVL